MMATIKDLLLEEDLLLEIFSHYVRSEGREAFSRNIPRVCKDWNRLSSKAPLWRDVTVRDLDYLLNVSRRGFLLHTRSLKVSFDCNKESLSDCNKESLSDCNKESLSDRNLSHVLKNIRDLKVLDLDDCNIVGGGDDITLLTENCPHLERLSLGIPGHSNTTPHDMDQFLNVCGPTLKELYLHYNGTKEAGQKLVSGIAAKCPLLEALGFFPYHFQQFPILEIRSGCPRLKKLQFDTCELITTGKNDSSLGCGFKYLETFTTIDCDFGGLDVYSLLKDSVDLEHLALYDNYNLVFDTISKLPLENVRILRIKLKDLDKDLDKNLEALGDVLWKLRHTLSKLYLENWEYDISSKLERFLQDNPTPQLKSLCIGREIKGHLFDEFLQKCRNLTSIVAGRMTRLDRMMQLGNFSWMVDETHS